MALVADASAFVPSRRPSGAVESFGWDRLGRRGTFTNAAGRMTRFALDPAGRVLAVTNALGQVRQFEYDDAGRPTAAVRPSTARVDCLPVTMIAPPSRFGAARCIELSLLRARRDGGRLWRGGTDPVAGPLRRRAPGLESRASKVRTTRSSILPIPE